MIWRYLKYYKNSFLCIKIHWIFFANTNVDMTKNSYSIKINNNFDLQNFYSQLFIIYNLFGLSNKILTQKCTG